MKNCKHCGKGAIHDDDAKKCAICGGTEFEHNEWATQDQINKQIEELLRIPKCPICGSTDLKKLTALDRSASAFMWGLGSNKIGKTYECKKCKATF